MSERKLIKCNSCRHCWANDDTEETYCEAYDGERITLRNGQWRPKWCPRVAWRQAERESQ